MSQPFEAPRPQTLSPVEQEFSQPERTLLLQLAHEAIASSLVQREIRPPHLPPHLTEVRRAVFTTLYINGRLRGCVGHVLPFLSLDQAIVQTARAAAFDDARFIPVTLAEASQLEVSLSILSPLFPIRAEDIVIGRHGLLVSQNGRRGLLLPQVPVQHAWDRITFLDQTCQKAFLPNDAWRHGATLEAFTAEVFGDRDIDAVESLNRP
jgi:AmmeMemoRadiSam system protein A